jgi:hypothetical protein
MLRCGSLEVFSFSVLWAMSLKGVEETCVGTGAPARPSRAKLGSAVSTNTTKGVLPEIDANQVHTAVLTSQHSSDKIRSCFGGPNSSSSRSEVRSLLRTPIRDRALLYSH